MSVIPVGKLPPSLLARLLADAPGGADVILGPAPGMDCAVVRAGDFLLALKSDPITFATENLGWYLVQVNANDLATVGAIPRWLLVTLLLPEGETTAELVTELINEIYAGCRELNIAVVGGHTEVTYGLERPLAVGFMAGEVPAGKLVTPQGAEPGDRLLLTKGIPLEGAAILARDFREELHGAFSPTELDEAAGYLFKPGIGVLRDAQVAQAGGTVHAMHDPTEGGLATALWELAEASGRALLVAPGDIPVLPLAARLCAFFGLDPLALIASGALLLAVPPGENARRVCGDLGRAGVVCVDIGAVVEGEPAVWQETENRRVLLPRPARDELARLFEREEPEAGNNRLRAQP
ncbi:MAG: AIR synthase family protein [Anaerolineae bacterium]|nr:AIR synthase family protein [Anaerolineae bacterium]